MKIKLPYRLDRLFIWTKKWRLKVNTQKTDVTCFSKSGHENITIFMVGSKLESVNNKTCLGLILDNNLNFRQQVELGNTSLNKLSIILNNLKNISIETRLYLYQSCIRCHLEYSFAVWSTASQSVLRKLDQVQRKCLMRISGADYSTPSSNLKNPLSHPSTQSEIG